jgi:hypothetical protein
VFILIDRRNAPSWCVTVYCDFARTSLTSYPAGPACLTCREKCRKCDRARPNCHRCISKGLVCGGYPEQFRFCGIASRGKWKGARIPVNAQRPRKAPNGIGTSQRSQGQQSSEIIDVASKSPDPAYLPSHAERPNADTQDSPDGIAEVLRRPETGTLLSHCELHHRSRIPDKHSDASVQMIVSFARISSRRLVKIAIIHIDCIFFP